MKERIDIILVNQGFISSREKAKALIMANQVLVNNVPINKPGQLIDITADIKIRGEKMPFVSRGGFKLLKGINIFNIDVTNKVCLDIGASTGGFTDCLLQHNAQKVFAIDVGTNQLDWSIRINPKVAVMEKTNFRYIDENLFKNEKISFVCCDVSFISLDKIIPKIVNIIEKDSLVFLLIKPQFETIPSNVDKGGVVNNKDIHLEVINKIINFAIKYELELLNLSYSPITGHKKLNIEYISLFTNNKNSKHLMEINDKIILAIINEAWNKLK